MTETRRGRVGVIGLGIYGQLHARTYATAPGAELVAVCDVWQDRAEATAKEAGYSAFTDYAQMLSDCELDAVSIALPDYMHADATIAAAKAGKHVLVEKPFAITVDQCEQMIRAVDENGVSLMTDFSERWSPVMQLAKKAITSGDLGKVQLGY